MPEQRGRFRLVDSMRALAALSVLFYHAAFRFPPPRGALGQYLTQRNAGPPITAVVLFFLISGFVLYRPFVAARYDGVPPPALGPYAVRRLARIVPGYWVALAVVAAWLGLSYVATPSGLIRYFGFLQLYANNRTAGGGIPVAWTLCVEISFYAVLPLLAIAVRRVGRGRSLLGSELTMCALMLLAALVWATIVNLAVPTANLWQLPLLSMLPGSLDFFAAGMALAVLSVEYDQRSQPAKWIAIVDRSPWLPWLLGLGVLYATPKLNGSVGPTAWWLSVHELKLLGAALLLLPVVFGTPNRGWLRRGLGWRPLIWLGTVSYGIYLWHDPLLIKLAPHAVSHGELYTVLVLGVLSVAVAALSYYLVERPAQRVARRWLRSLASRRERTRLGALVARGPAPAPPDARA